MCVCVHSCVCACNGVEWGKAQLFTSSDTGNKIYFVSGAVRQLLAADGKGQLHTGLSAHDKKPKISTFSHTKPKNSRFSHVKLPKNSSLFH